MKKEKLINICTPRQWKTLSTSELMDKGYPVYGANGIIGYYDSYNHESETVMVTCRGATCGMVNLSEPFSYINGNAMCMDDVRDDVDTRYLYYALKQYDFKNIISGSAQPQITRQGLSKVYISITNKEKQLEIVESLSKVEQLLDNKKLLLLEYDQLIKSRFVEMFENDMNYKNSWKIDYLGNLVTIVRGASPRPIQSFITEDENGINWIKIGDAKVDSMYIWATKEKITPEGAKKSRHVKEGDFLLSNSMSFGRPYILKTTGCVHDGWLVLSKYEDHFNKYFLYALLNSETVYNKFKSMVVGGVVNNLNSEMVRNLEVFVPPIDIQNEFARILKQIDKLKFEVLKLLRELR